MDISIMSGTVWTSEEDQRLCEEYVEEELSLKEICDLHKRNPMGVIMRLLKLGLIEVRGYHEGIELECYHPREVKQKEPSTMRAEIGAIRKDVSSILQIVAALGMAGEYVE